MNVAFSSPLPACIDPPRAEERHLGDVAARCPPRCPGTPSAVGVIARVNSRFAHAITQCAIAAAAPLSCSESCTKPSPRSPSLSGAFQDGRERAASREPLL